ncbi:MAG: glutamine synthetase family protein [Pirellulales bacterium]|nr:glutamine synthetase family protein [Pirellulales bacterium]
MSAKHDSGFLPAWFTADEIDTVIVAVPDVYGRLLGKRFTYSHFARSVEKSGTHLCNYLLTVDVEMNPMPGFRLASWDQGYGDFHAAVDLHSMRRLPWHPGTALAIADLLDADHRPIAPSPRAVLRRQLERLSSADQVAMMASELEFYLFHNSYAEAHALTFRDLTPSSDYLIDYHLLQPGRDEDLMRRLRNEMTDAGIVVEGSKGEWGRGQHEVNLLYAEALQMADQHVIYKYGAKDIAAQLGRAITFMAKWDAQQAGSSFHLHTSLWNKNESRNLFWDATKSAGSAVFRQFLGGLLKYGRELCYFFAPTVNSYKRFQAASWAPTRLAWAYDNRTTALRVVGHGDGFRIENRSPGADANPYLAFAATLAAGLAGIAERLDCGEPYRGNAYEDETLPRLPQSLEEAAELLNASQVARAALGDEVVDFYVHTARLEAGLYRAAVTDWERQRYFEQL